MKVFVVMANSWNGDHDVMGVDRVFLDEDAAATYVDAQNERAKEMGSYATTYEYEEYTTE
jgi:5,10-methylene-tetrahydrofolate dehydrogenase/methenyl tetrahydrofolate cyclohydrolase